MSSADHAGHGRATERDVSAPSVIARSEATRQSSLPAQHTGLPRFARNDEGGDYGKFVFQFPKGPHVADFACRTARLVVELDGSQHADMAEEDAARTAVLEAFGFRVIRFWNSEVNDNLDGVLEAIRQELLIARNRAE